MARHSVFVPNCWPGHWEEDYIGALDMENDMPADEGDLLPWGGPYLYILDSDACALALEF